MKQNNTRDDVPITLKPIRSERTCVGYNIKDNKII